jgi:hypothetical protein
MLVTPIVPDFYVFQEKRGTLPSIKDGARSPTLVMGILKVVCRPKRKRANPVNVMSLSPTISKI